jgi:cell division inhibitor SepF
MNQHAEMEEYDELRPQGFFARMRDRIMGHDEYDDEEEADTAAAAPAAQPAVDPLRASGGSSVPLRRSAATLRLDHARRTHVTVRRAMRSFEDAQRAADGLKEGQQQIVNLEQTPVEMSERIIDFLNGATYALDGSVEKIGEQVYLFTPATVTIDVEDKPAAGPRPSFLDQMGS